jgi:hypothetical protein
MADALFKQHRILDQRQVPETILDLDTLARNEVEQIFGLDLVGRISLYKRKVAGLRLPISTYNAFDLKRVFPALTLT